MVPCRFPIASIRSAISSPRRPRPFLRQSRRPLPSRRPDARPAPVGVAHLDLLPCSNSRGGTATCGARATPNCSSSTSRPRSRPVTARASSAAGTMRRPLPPPSRGGLGAAVVARARRRHGPRAARRAARRPCQAAHRLPIDDLPDGAFLTLARDDPGAAPSRCAAPACCGGRRRATSGRPRPRGIAVDVLTPPAILAALSPATGRAGIRAPMAVAVRVRHSSCRRTAVHFVRHTLAPLHLITGTPRSACASAGTSCRPSASGVARTRRRSAR